MRTMGQVLVLFILASVALSATAGQDDRSPSGSGSASLDPAAVAALDQMGLALRQLDQFTLRAITTTEYVLNDGQKVALDGTVDYQVDQPNQFYVEVKSEKQQQRYFYDGTTLVIHSPRLKYYSEVPVSKSNQDLLVEAMEKYGIEFPLADLFLWGTPHFTQTKFISAVSLGEASVAGDRARHYAFRQPGADWQVWISTKSHLPLRLVIASVDDPALPAYAANLVWGEGGGAAAHSYHFKPPADASKIPFEPATVPLGAFYAPGN